MNTKSLILEGGGMRGVYTTGVLDFFLEHNIEFDQIIGVSAGTCHACSYISKQKERAYKVNTDYLDDKRYLSWSNFIKEGSIFGMDMLFNIIPNELHPINDIEFNNSKTKLFATCTNLNSGKAEYFHIKDINKDSKYIEAGCSIPGLSNIVYINSEPYLDGGIGDSIPIKKAIKDGYKKNVIILTRDIEYTKERNKMINILKLKYHKYPNFIKAIRARHINYNNTLKFIKKEEAKGNCFVIRPSKALNISNLEKNKVVLKDLYDLGYNDAKNNYGGLVEFLNSL
ncbi:MAG: patatin family protein [Erysipelotrichaceae bacterium]